jgi:hypothetical protein
MTDNRQVTEADLDATIARAFGHAPPRDPAKSTLSLEEALDVRMGHVFNRPGITAVMAREAEGVIAYHAQQVAVVEAESAMSAAQEAQLEGARLRAASAAASQGRTAAEATGYSRALLRHVQSQAVTEGRSFGQVIDLIDRVAQSLRARPRDGAGHVSEASKGRTATRIQETSRTRLTR